jgi:hypothetical protein
MFALLRSRRIGTITGPKDQNYDEITHATQFMKDDGLNYRVFEYAGMGHEMPTPEHFAEALKWVDEPYQATRAKEEASASALLARHTARGGEHPPANDKERQELMKVTEEGPWTDAAWKAVGLLRAAGAKTDGN